jgi:hypothetical protein
MKSSVTSVTGIVLIACVACQPQGESLLRADITRMCNPPAEVLKASKPFAVAEWMYSNISHPDALALFGRIAKESSTALQQADDLDRTARAHGIEVCPFADLRRRSADVGE